MLKGNQRRKRPAVVSGTAAQSDQFPAEFVDWARGEIGEATERLQYKSLRKACREKLNTRISYLSRAIDRVE